MKMKTWQPETFGIHKSSAKGKVHRNTSLPQETREASNKWLNFTLKAAKKEEMKNPGVSRRKEIIKIRAEISEKERKETSKNQQK